MTDKRRCETCLFHVSGVIGERLGVCRRHAPAPIIGIISASAVRANKNKTALFRPSVWPLTEPHDWCGEYRYSEDKP